MHSIRVKHHGIDSRTFPVYGFTYFKTLQYFLDYFQDFSSFLDQLYSLEI